MYVRAEEHNRAFPFHSTSIFLLHHSDWRNQLLTHPPAAEYGGGTGWLIYQCRTLYVVVSHCCCMLAGHPQSFPVCTSSEWLILELFLIFCNTLWAAVVDDETLPGHLPSPDASDVAAASPVFGVIFRPVQTSWKSILYLWTACHHQAPLFQSTFALDSDLQVDQPLPAFRRQDQILAAAVVGAAAAVG